MARPQQWLEADEPSGHSHDHPKPPRLPMVMSLPQAPRSVGRCGRIIMFLFSHVLVGP